MEAKGSSTVYDFEHARVFQLDQKTKTIQDNSLYADVGFRVLEFFNRVNLGTMMHSAKIDTQLFDLAAIEHLFSLSADKSDTVVDSVETNGTKVYRAKQTVLMTVSDRTQSLPAASQGDYWRFMRYYVGGHPAIYASLAPVKGVPIQVVVELHNLGVETRTLKLESIRTGPDTAYSLDGYQRASPNTEPFVALRLVDANAPEALALRVTRARQDRDDAFARGDYVGAMLAYDDMLLSNGTGEPEWLKMAYNQLTADPATQRLNGAAASGARTVRDSVAQKKALEEFATLRTLNPTYVDVLDVFEANVRIALREEHGQDLLFDALHVNPYLIGAWHDLGDSYYRAFRMPDAWTCWDVARRISPSAPMMREVDQLEQLLRAKNPQFF
jgi:hypothetical protein